MGKYKFRPEQRYALWLTYGKKCFWCSEPFSFREVTVDHIIPEYLLDDPDKLKIVLHDYRLDTSFSINDYCNWAPAHNHCNREKGTTIYSASPAMITTLERVRQKATAAKLEEEKIIRAVHNDKLLGKYEIASKRGKISKAEWVAKIESDHDKRILVLENEWHQKKEEFLRQNDAIAYLKTKRKFEGAMAVAQIERDLALKYIEDVLGE
ncbi:MAG: HNH endonuclease [Anaerolineae bacterium]|nr:HNH endonuclease [Anaerolineae bacterium]